MKSFIGEDFLLNSSVARELYHRYGKRMPIYDYHCHLNPRDIAVDRKYSNLTELWLEEDHYKWRLMRGNGIPERYITGDASPKEKFIRWAGTIEKAIGNPLYHWTHLELKRYFGIDELLTSRTAEYIWNRAIEILDSENLGAKRLIEMSNVRVIYTTDDPLDTLEDHLSIARDSRFQTKVLPTFRPDKAIKLEKDDFTKWIASLERVVGREVKSLEDLLLGLEERIDFFHTIGCRVSDHGLDEFLYTETSLEEADRIFRKGRENKDLSLQEKKLYKSYIMEFLGREYSKKGWVMQLHMGCMRNNSSRMYSVLGVDSGFDTIGDTNYIEELARYLDSLDSRGRLPKTILYNLNPKDNEALAALIGCFQGSEAKGKVQFGAGWWFLDQKDGMVRQMTALANQGLICNFVGMLTDSRSFLSYTRHEYFRRILCNLLGEWVERGEAPNNLELLGGIVEDISYNNVLNYIGE